MWSAIRKLIMYTHNRRKTQCAAAVYSDGAGMVICWPSQQWLIQCVYACAIRAIHGEAPTNISFHLSSFLIFFFFWVMFNDVIAKWRGGGWTRAKSYSAAVIAAAVYHCIVDYCLASFIPFSLVFISLQRKKNQLTLFLKNLWLF
jgi:hypothetical protein